MIVLTLALALTLVAVVVGIVVARASGHRSWPEDQGWPTDDQSL